MIPDKQILDYMWEQSCLLWAVDNKIRTEKGIDLEFKNHCFLKDIFDDFSQVQVIRKASQIGFSTMAILKTLWAAKKKKWNIIYTLPTFGDVNQFVPSKVNPIISVNPTLTRWTEDKNSVLQKKVGDRFIYYRGTFSQKSEKEKMESGVGIMLTADLNVHDESDRSDQVILEQYESRLEASEYAGRWYFSNPTHPHTLSQELFKQSDQKHWFIKCEHCNHWQYLEYDKNICQERKIYICQKCGKELTDENRRKGRWVKKYKKDISGYWINHLMAPWIPASKIIEESEKKTKQYFMNFILGLPYIGSDVVVDKNVILGNIDYSEPNFLQGNVLGVDSGLKKHYVLGNKQGIFRVGYYDKWEDIEVLIRKFDVKSAVIDALPDLTEPRKLRDKFPGVVYLHYFKKEVRKANFITWETDSRTVYSDRTKIIQQVIDEFLDRKIRFQMKPEELSEFIRHWEALYKVVEKDNLGIERDFWESNGADHLAMATIYWRLALMKTGTGEIKKWRKGDKIFTNRAPDIMELAKKSETI